MYRAKGIKTLNFSGNYNILGKTGVIMFASEKEINDPEALVSFKPDDDTGPIPNMYCCRAKYFEILGKVDE